MLKRIATSISDVLCNLSAGIILNSHPEWIPRVWSNREIRKIGHMFSGDVVNVSGWRDSDKYGGKYRDYFPNAKSYSITNYGVEVGSSGSIDEKELDLSIPYKGGIGVFDHVFSHTVIEHVFPSSMTIENLCRLSRQDILTVVPFLQGFHGVADGYTDYYRYSPLTLERAFGEFGFKTVYVSWNNDHPLYNVYIVHLSSNRPEIYRDVLPPKRIFDLGEDVPGIAYTRFLYPTEEQMGAARKIGNWIGNFVRLR